MYILLTVLMVIFGAIAFLAFVLFILSGCELPEVLLVTLVAGIIAVGLGIGVSSIQEANTTIHKDIVQMEVTKFDITSERSNGSTTTRYFLTVGNKYVVQASPEKYAELNVGDVVDVEITTTTVFDETTQTVNLKN